MNCVRPLQGLRMREKPRRYPAGPAPGARAANPDLPRRRSGAKLPLWNLSQNE